MCIVHWYIRSTRRKNTLVTIISVAVGALIGELIDIDKWVNKLGAFYKVNFLKEIKRFYSRGFYII